MVFFPGKALSLRSLRHMLIALARTLHSPEEVDASFDIAGDHETLSERLRRVARVDSDSVEDLMAGHSSRTALVYGVEGNTIASGRMHRGHSGAMTADKAYQQRTISLAFHRFFGLDGVWSMGGTSSLPLHPASVTPVRGVVGVVGIVRDSDSDAASALPRPLPEMGIQRRLGEALSELETSLPSLVARAVPGAIQLACSSVITSQIGSTGGKVFDLPEPESCYHRGSPVALSLLRSILSDSRAVFRSPAQATAASMIVSNQKHLLLVDATNGGKTAVVGVGVRHLSKVYNKLSLMLVPFLGLMIQHAHTLTRSYGVDVYVWTANGSSPSTIPRSEICHGLPLAYLSSKDPTLPSDRNCRMPSSTSKPRPSTSLDSFTVI